MGAALFFLPFPAGFSDAAGSDVLTDLDFAAATATRTNAAHLAARSAALIVRQAASAANVDRPVTAMTLRHSICGPLSGKRGDDPRGPGGALKIASKLIPKQAVKALGNEGIDLDELVKLAANPKAHGTLLEVEEHQEKEKVIISLE